MMDKSEVLQVLRKYFDEFGQEYGIQSLGVFGSVARDGATDESDVDVVVRLEKPNLFTLSGIRIDLEERVNCHVDLINDRERMNPFLKERILKEVCYV